MPSAVQGCFGGEAKALRTLVFSIKPSTDLGVGAHRLGSQAGGRLSHGPPGAEGGGTALLAS